MPDSAHIRPSHHAFFRPAPMRFVTAMMPKAVAYGMHARCADPGRENSVRSPQR
jgi:hypothetical protein